MCLNLNQKTTTPSPTYCISATYTEAVNDAQFVRLFGVAVLAGSIVGHFLPLHIGIAFAILGFGNTNYYRGLGISAVILSFLFPPIGAATMCIGIGYKGLKILETLSREGEGDPDWRDTRNRAIVGTVLSGVGLFVESVWLVITLTNPGLFKFN